MTVSPAEALHRAFDLTGPLPTGTTVLEASAGTGKTFTLAGLVARYIAEGRARMDELLVVSFSRESTRELRERVRERLAHIRDALGDDAVIDTARIDSGDRVLAHLATGDPGEIAVRARRLEVALASYDAATVATTHGFCQQVLLALGTASDHDEAATLVEDIGDLVTEVADDLYVSRWGRPGADPPALDPATFRALALAVSADPATPLVPDPADQANVPARAAAAVRAEVERRKRRLTLIDYDDLQVRLARTLTDPQSGPTARARLRARFRIVLVDEFQDTDPVQWTILREAFHGHSTLVLVGDPKQAIYRFRGADVHAYLQAAAAAGSVSTLPVNYRSDAPLLRGLDAVFRGAALGHPQIRVSPVAAFHPGRLVGTPGGPDAAVRLRVLPRDDLPLTQSGVAKTAEARGAVVGDVVAETVRLLDGGAQVHPRDGAGAARPLRPGDIAVLVRTNDQARLVSTRLRDARVPVVVSGRTSVFATPAAHEWQLLLEALEQPNRTTRVRRLALGCFVGLTAADLADRGDAAADALALDLRAWTHVLDDRGVAALFEAVSLSSNLQQRVLGAPDGERLLTDLRHIAQALHVAAVEGQLGLTALTAWLRRRRDEAKTDSGLERSRRLSSDAAAVQVITVHMSKGLEFPVVMVPFAWDLFVRSTPLTAVYHDDDGTRIRDVGGPGSPGWDEHVARHQQEEIDDELRLTYVALTRAQSRLLLWWAPTTNTPQAPLHRLLFHDDPHRTAPQRVAVPGNDDAALATLRALAAGSDGCLSVETVRPRPATPWTPDTPVATALTAASLDRTPDLGWRRTSYSSLTSAAHAAHEQALASESEIGQKDDEGEGTAPAPPTGSGGDLADPDAALLDVPSEWDAMPSGARFGTFVHGVLERLDDFGDPAAVAGAVSAEAARSGSGGDPADLLGALTTALATPLGPLANDLALRDIPRGDRLHELDFELPLAGGDEPGSGRPGVAGRRPTLRDLVPLWRRHADGPLASYADALAALEPATLHGYLTGSIDTVLRVAGPGGPSRYLVVDYKTNRLGGGEPLTAWHYRPGAMRDAMIEAHYPLQALLYSVALHRYLRWRQPGYDPGVHLGGILYLFLRGMSGPGLLCADGSAPGVFAWRPPARLVTGTSDLLAGALEARR